MKSEEIDDYVVEYDDSDLTKDAVFEAVINFFKKHGAFSGECIMQSDGPNLDAPEFLADLADNVLKFEVRDK